MCVYVHKVLVLLVKPNATEIDVMINDFAGSQPVNTLFEVSIIDYKKV